MKVFIDQSGKIENTEKDTVIAFTNKISASIRIPAKVKRLFQKIYRKKGKPKLYIYETFAFGIFLLLKNYLSWVKDVVIDKEYPGHEKMVKQLLLELIEKNKLKIPHIEFARIGRKPRVHYAAHDVFEKKKKPTYEISLKTILALTKK
ncbi:MAG: hypothetical protein ACOZBZ_01250 [Patescibacteria group bacterium]